jgi:hypothetical protein
MSPLDIVSVIVSYSAVSQQPGAKEEKKHDVVHRASREYRWRCMAQFLVVKYKHTEARSAIPASLQAFFLHRALYSGGRTVIYGVVQVSLLAVAFLAHGR